MEKRKLGILLSTQTSHPSVDTVAALSSEALRVGCEVYLYLIDEGVANVHDARVGRLVDAGAKLFVCAYGCQQHDIPTEGIDSRISLCGLVVLSGMITGCDRFLTFA